MSRPRPFEVKQQQAWAKYGHLPILFENVNNDKWRQLSAAKQVPVGGFWCAALGIVFGPELKT